MKRVERAPVFVCSLNARGACQIEASRFRLTAFASVEGETRKARILQPIVDNAAECGPKHEYDFGFI